MNQQPSDHGGFRLRSHPHRSASDCRMVSDAIEEYTLGIADSAQSAAIERHLLGCAECSALVSSYLQTTAVLALAVPLVAPPASARTALFDRIAVTSHSASPARGVFAGSLDDLRTPTLPSSAQIAPLPFKPEKQSAWWHVYAAPLATLPLILALGLVAAWGFNNYAQLHSTQGDLAQRDMQIARLNAQLDNDTGQGVAQMLASQSAKRYALTSDGSSGTLAQGMLVADPQSERAALQVSGLPSGTYTVVVQLQNGAMVPTTEFEVGAGGTGSTLVNLGTQIDNLRSVHIRPATTVTVTDVAAIEAQSDALMTLIGPDISDDADTSVQKP